MVTTQPPWAIDQTITKRKLTDEQTQWIRGRTLGSGTFGTVYKETSSSTGAVRAVKEVRVKGLERKELELQTGELRALIKFTDKNNIEVLMVLNCRSSLTWPGYLYLLMLFYCSAPNISLHSRAGLTRPTERHCALRWS